MKFGLILLNIGLICSIFYNLHLFSIYFQNYILQLFLMISRVFVNKSYSKHKFI